VSSKQLLDTQVKKKNNSKKIKNEATRIIGEDELNIESSRLLSLDDSQAT
jgi:hypothetical protein